MSSLNLIFDADDTLWENNIYFEQAITEFEVFAGDIRETLISVQRQNPGSGSMYFTRMMVEAYRTKFGPVPCYMYELIAGIGARRLFSAEREVFNCVPYVLTKLASIATLTMLTRGDREEQLFKIDRSGLGQYFTRITIVTDKTPEKYQKFVSLHGMDGDSTWMIGNSTKYDINPALRAGINAVHIQNTTWCGEEENLVQPADNRQLVTIKDFKELLGVFGTI